MGLHAAAAQGERRGSGTGRGKMRRRAQEYRGFSGADLASSRTSFVYPEFAMRILISLALALPSGIEAGADSVFRSKLCELGGGGMKCAGRVTLRGGSAASAWCRDFEDLAPGFSIAAQPRAEAAHQDEVEALFRHAFFLTHYRLNFVQARQLLDRVLVLNPQHVPALTTLVAPHVLNSAISTAAVHALFQ